MKYTFTTKEPIEGCYNCPICDSNGWCGINEDIRSQELRPKICPLKEADSKKTLASEDLSAERELGNMNNLEGI